VVAKKKTWGDEGFETTIHYGAYDYTVKFVAEEEIRQFVKEDNEDISVFGGVNCYKQMILVSAGSTPQTQKATLLHELVHAVLLRNGNSQDLDEKGSESEELTDTIALGMFELIRRNPELMRWLEK
jgi:Zn-dependent peptidase ImmA (M78 family)